MQAQRVLVALRAACAFVVGAPTLSLRAVRGAAVAMALALSLAAPSPARADVLEAPVILVAAPAMSDPLYETSVIVVTPLGGGGHVGFIVNRPSGFVLLDHRPGGQDLTVPIYIGGSLMPDVIVALVQGPIHPGGHSVPVLPGLYAANEADVLKRIIAERQPARFVAGMVAWRAGQLEAEIERGGWYVLEPDVRLLRKPPEALWEELVHRSERRRQAL